MRSFYPILFTLGWMVYVYTNGINVYYLDWRYMLEAMGLGVLYWIPWIVWSERWGKRKWLFLVFCLHIGMLFGKDLVKALLPDMQFDGWLYAHRWVLFMGAMGLGAIGAVWVLRRMRWSDRIAQVLNVSFTILLALVLRRLGDIWPDIRRGAPAAEAAADGSHLPNIFHICLDMHMGAEFLAKIHQYDAEPFYRKLEALGFWTDRHSMSNYQATIPSFASMFQMQYLPAAPIGERAWMRMLKRSATAIERLRAHGYRCIHTNLYNAIWSDAFHEATDRKTRRQVWETLLLPTAFNRLLPYRAHLRSLVQAHLDSIHQLIHAARAYPPNGHYCFTHIVAPHPPFYFDQHSWNDFNHEMGRVEAFTHNDAHYADPRARVWMAAQVRHTDALTLMAIREILAAYDEDHAPIILLHGDHGDFSLPELPAPQWPTNATEKEKAIFSNLYAIYLPKRYRSALPTPPGLVNTFRWLFNTLFNEQNPFLDSTQIAYDYNSQAFIPCGHWWKEPFQPSTEITPAK